MINFLRKRHKTKAGLTAYALENNGQKEAPSVSKSQEGAIIRVQLLLAFGWAQGITSLTQFAKYAGIGHSSTLSGLLSGSRKVRPETLNHIYTAFEKFKQEVKPDIDKYLEAEEKTELQKQIEKPTPNDQPGQETIPTDELDMPAQLADSIDFGYQNKADVPVGNQNASLNELTYANAFRIPPGTEVFEKPLRDLKSISPLWVVKNGDGFHYLQGSYTASDGTKQYMVIMPNPQFMETDGFNHSYPPYMVFFHNF